MKRICFNKIAAVLIVFVFTVMCLPGLNQIVDMKAYASENPTIGTGGSTILLRTSSGNTQYSINDGGNWYTYTGTITFSTDGDASSMEVLSGTHNIIFDNLQLTGRYAADYHAFHIYDGANVNLTLKNVNSVTGYKYPVGDSYLDGICVGQGSSLTISGDGELRVENTLGTAIGSGIWGALGSNSITINGGEITAVGGSGGSGIDAQYITINGGTVSASAASSSGSGINGKGIKITGGTVTATGPGYEGVGISTIESSSFTNSVDITGGTVTATGGTASAAIKGDTVNITGGTVEVTGKAGTSKNTDIVCTNRTISSSVCGYILKAGTSVSFTKSSGMMKCSSATEDMMNSVIEYYVKPSTSVTFTTTKTLESSQNYLWQAADGDGNVVASQTTTSYEFTLSMPSKNVTVTCSVVDSVVDPDPVDPDPIYYNYYDPSDGGIYSASPITKIKSDTADTPTTLTGSGDTGGWFYVTDNVTISSWIIVDGNVNIILGSDCKFTVETCIVVSEGNSLTIWSENSKNSGLLNAGNKEIGAAGIGGDYGSSSGTITINGGTVCATSKSGAGIGGGYYGAGGVITINGGTVRAQSYSGAGIGDGNNGSGGTITINSGSVTAESSLGAGIGGGYNGAGGVITINGGTVKASNGNFCAGIGGGYNGAGGVITINGGTVIAKGGTNGAGIGGGENGNSGTIKISGNNTKITVTPGTEAEGIGCGNGGTKNSSDISVTVPCVTESGIAESGVARYRLDLTDCELTSGDYKIYGADCLYVAVSSASVQTESAPSEGYCNEWTTSNISEYTESKGQTFSFTMPEKAASISAAAISCADHVHMTHTQETDNSSIKEKYTPQGTCEYCGYTPDSIDSNASFIVTIPKTVTITDSGGSGTISAQNSLGYAKTLSITTDSSVTLNRSDNKEIASKVTCSMTNVSVANGATTSKTVTFGKPVYNNDSSATIPAGEYTGTLTFTITLE